MTDPALPDPNAQSVGIDGVVEQLTFTRDGNLLLASTGAGAVAVWDGKAAEATVTEVAPGRTVSQLAISPDGTTVATGSLSDPGSMASDPLLLWRFDGLKLAQMGQTEHTSFGFGLLFAPDGKHLVIGGINEFAIYPLDGGDTITVPFKDDMTRSLAIAPGGKTVAVGLWSGPVRFYDLQTGNPTGDELRQAGRAAAIAFRDNNVLVTASSDGSFKLWDPVSLRSLSVRRCPR